MTGFAVTASLLLGGCSQQGAPSLDEPSIARSPAGDERGTELARRLAAADAQIVDCRLPPRIRRLGTQRVYLEPQRPVRTTGRDCGIRGGDAVVFDPSNYATALAIWLPLAEEGDPKAQTYVGDIYERGLTGSPDYARAAEWYRRAADQGYASAQVSLGQLYERGVGVPQDRTRAMNLYRQASGLEAPLEIVAAGEVQALRDEVSAREQEAQELRAQIERLEQELSSARADQRLLEQDIVAERQSLDRLRQELLEQKQALENGRLAADAARADHIQDQQAELERREALLAEKEQQLFRSEEQITKNELDLQRAQSARRHAGESPVTLSSAKFGNYYALVIGSNNYGKGLRSLKSAIRDAQTIGAMLEDRYGYVVHPLFDPSRDQILDALNVYQRLGPQDNLLIYYAGHGALDEENDRGFWLPADADPSNKTNWISNIDISDRVNSMQAKHVLVIADSCYSGALTDTQPVLFEMPRLLEVLPHDYADWITAMINQPARLAFTSGNLEPVPDGSNGSHSIFAGALLESLGTNNDVLSATRLWITVTAKVSDAASRLGRSQMPTYRMIRSTKYQGGDFFFVPSEAGQLAQTQ